ncbi:hypothetical protein [Thioflexithrix psekupsensis]|uniref:hypothetical protein n=1 Tax=Thioflexithrix psekupsensis TaxID=1570016 RepID=UPI001594B31E|nr:hypothetical protein [Thioflexithrix psekupsensis]
MWEYIEESGLVRFELHLIASRSHTMWERSHDVPRRVSTRITMWVHDAARQDGIPTWHVGMR